MQIKIVTIASVIIIIIITWGGTQCHALPILFFCASTTACEIEQPPSPAPLHCSGGSPNLPRANFEGHAKPHKQAEIIVQGFC